VEAGGVGSSWEKEVWSAASRAYLRDRFGVLNEGKEGH
jgi:hypothetical protein